MKLTQEQLIMRCLAALLCCVVPVSATFIGTNHNLPYSMLIALITFIIAFSLLGLDPVEDSVADDPAPVTDGGDSV